MRGSYYLSSPSKFFIVGGRGHYSLIPKPRRHWCDSIVVEFWLKSYQIQAKLRLPLALRLCQILAVIRSKSGRDLAELRVRPDHGQILAESRSEYNTIVVAIEVINWSDFGQNLTTI